MFVLDREKVFQTLGLTLKLGLHRATVYLDQFAFNPICETIPIWLAWLKHYFPLAFRIMVLYYCQVKHLLCIGIIDITTPTRHYCWCTIRYIHKTRHDMSSLFCGLNYHKHQMRRSRDVPRGQFKVCVYFLVDSFENLVLPTLSAPILIQRFGKTAVIGLIIFIIYSVKLY